MDILAKVVYGSKLYGTDVPESDQDYRGIYLPTLDDCILGTVKDTITIPEEEDTQYFSLQYFLNLAAQGQSIAIEMLSAPQSAVVISSPVWEMLQAERKRFYTKNMKAFLGYAKSQSSKYSSRIDRLNEAEAIQKAFRQPWKKSIEDIRLGDIWYALPESTNAIKTTNERNQNDDKRVYQVCGRELQATVTVAHAARVVQNIIESYGERVRKAKDGDLDWKAFAHAFRVASQAYLIVKFGNLAYPLYNAEYLRDLRLGKYNFLEEKLDEKLDILIEEVQTLLDQSNLPDGVDQKWLNQIIIDCYVVATASRGASAPTIWGDGPGQA